MRKTLYLLTIMALCFSTSGCATSPRVRNRWVNRVNHWLPAGISRDDARRIMKQHGFRVYIDSADRMVCDKKTAFHLIEVTMSFIDGKLTHHNTIVEVPIQI